MKKISAVAFYFLLFTFTFPVFAQDETRVSAAWRVLKYDVTATLPQNATDRILSARAVLNLQNVGNGAGSRLTLRISDKAEVTSVSVNNSVASFSKGEESLGTTSKLQRIFVSVPSVQPNATVTVSVEYRLKTEENSGLNSLSPMGAQFLPFSFWYPTPNSHFASRGADFAPFRLTVNSSGKVISSGTQNANSFEQKLNGQPFFIAGDWETVEAKGVTVFLPKGASEFERQRAGELANLAVEAKTFTASLLGSVTETPTRIVAVRRGSGFADAGTILLDYGAFRRQKIDSQTVMTIAEAIAKIWLGNARPVRGEGYGVIREGLSRFIATQFIEKQFGKDAADIERLKQRTAYAVIAGRDAPWNQISPRDEFYFSSVANKGAMTWRLVAKQMGLQNLFNYIKTQETLTMLNIRTTFSNTYPALDFPLTNATDTNLLVGLPQARGTESKVALRNTGSITANVTVSAITDKGERLTATTSIQPKSFGEVTFKTASKIIRTEIDAEKLYPQTDYSDDIAPREFAESDAILAIKRAFDKQDFPTAEKNARVVLKSFPHFDDARIWLGRALLAQNKTAEAEKEFRAVLEEKLPSPRSLAWANVGLGEIALKANQTTQALNFFNEAIKAEAEYGATFNARLGRNKAETNPAVDETVRAFFAQFDKAATSGRKADLDALILSGEIPKFSSGIGGQAQVWETRLLRVDRIDANNVLAEVSLNIRLLNKDAESGTAVFLLSKVGGSWKLSGVDIFEVR